MALINNILAITGKKKHQIINLIFFTGLVAVFDLCSTFAVLPFVLLITNREAVMGSSTLKLFEVYYGPMSYETIFSLSCFFGIALILLSSLGRSVGNWHLIRLRQHKRHQLSQGILSKYLSLESEDIQGLNIEELISEVSTEADFVVNSVYQQVQAILVSSIVTLAMLVPLLYTFPFETALFGLALALIYTSMFKIVLPLVARMSQQRLTENNKRYQRMTEILGMRDLIKLFGEEKKYLATFSTPSLRMADAIAKAQAAAQLPKFLVEALSFALLLSLGWLLHYFSDSGPNSYSTVLSTLAVFAVVGYRLLPVYQSFYSAIMAIKFAVQPLENFVKRLGTDISFEDAPIVDSNWKRIELSPISAKDKKYKKSLVEGGSITVNRGETIGIVGASGSGKTTLSRVLLGLKTSDKTIFYRDGKPMNKSRQASIRAGFGYVPQNTAFFYGTLLENISGRENLNVEELAHLHRLIGITSSNSFLNDNVLSSYINQSGSSLSGGQKQRVALIRALFRRPTLLVLDEAGAGVGEVLEKKIISNIRENFKDMAIIIITHHVAVTSEMERVYEVHEGSFKQRVNAGSKK